MPLQVTVKQRGEGGFLILASGPIDTNTYLDLKKEVEAVLQKSPKLIIFNLKDVAFVSSAGIGVVLMAEQTLKPQGGNVVLVNVQPQVRRVFDIVKALPPQQIFASVEDLDSFLALIQRKVIDGEME